MTTYRVEVDGQTVWTGESPEPQPARDAFPAEYLARPNEPKPGEPHPAPHVLYVDDVVIGVQRSHADEADQLTAAAAEYEAAGDMVAAAQHHADAAQATVHALIAATQQQGA